MEHPHWAANIRSGLMLPPPPGYVPPEQHKAVWVCKTSTSIATEMVRKLPLFFWHFQSKASDAFGMTGGNAGSDGRWRKGRTLIWYAPLKLREKIHVCANRKKRVPHLTAHLLAHRAGVTQPYGGETLLPSPRSVYSICNNCLKNVKPGHFQYSVCPFHLQV
jgi:hypothetical protein